MLPGNINVLCAEICSFISENLLAENVEINPDTVLSHLGIDSYSIIEILLFIERKYGVVIPEYRLTPENFKSVKSIADCALQIAAEAKTSGR